MEVEYIVLWSIWAFCLLMNTIYWGVYSPLGMKLIYQKITLLWLKNKTIHSGSQGGLQMSITPSPRSMMTSSDLCEHQACMWCTNIHTDKTFITHLNFLNYLRLIYFHYAYACLTGDLCIWVQLQLESKRDLWIPWGWCTGSFEPLLFMWVLETKLLYQRSIWF